MGRAKTDVERAERNAKNAMQQLRKNSGSLSQASAGENSDLLNFNIGIANLKPININDASEVAERTGFYFAYCVQKDVKPTIASYGLALGLTRQRVKDVKNGIEKVPLATREIVQKACLILESTMENLMLDGKINPVGGIFLMRNNFEYTNEEIAVVSKSDPLGELKDINAIKEKYKDIPDD